MLFFFSATPRRLVAHGVVALVHVVVVVVVVAVVVLVVVVVLLLLPPLRITTTRSVNPLSPPREHVRALPSLASFLLFCSRAFSSAVATRAQLTSSGNERGKRFALCVGDAEFGFFR